MFTEQPETSLINSRDHDRFAVSLNFRYSCQPAWDISYLLADYNRSPPGRTFADFRCVLHARERTSCICGTRNIHDHGSSGPQIIRTEPEDFPPGRRLKSPCRRSISVELAIFRTILSRTARRQNFRFPVAILSRTGSFLRLNNEALLRADVNQVHPAVASTLYPYVASSRRRRLID